MYARNAKISISILTFLAIFSAIGFSNNCFEGINPNQPISPGEIIYREESLGRHSVDFYSTVSIRYLYIGIEKNNIKFERTEYSGDSTGNNQETHDLILRSLDENKQAFLEISPHTRRLKAVKLIIAVTDDADKINVQESESPSEALK